MRRRSVLAGLGTILAAPAPAAPETPEDRAVRLLAELSEVFPRSLHGLGGFRAIMDPDGRYWLQSTHRSVTLPARTRT